MSESMPSLLSMQTEPVLFQAPPLHAGDAKHQKKKKKPLIVNHLQKQFIYSIDELHDFVESNKNLILSMIQPLSGTERSVTDEQISRYELLRDKKAISSKKVTRELGDALGHMRESFKELLSYLNEIDIELNKEDTGLVAPLTTGEMPSPSLPTLQILDSAIEKGFIESQEEQRPPRQSAPVESLDLQEMALDIEERQEQQEEKEEQPMTPPPRSRRQSIIIEQPEKLCFSAISLVLQCIHKILQKISILMAIPGLYPENEGESPKKKKITNAKTFLQKKDNYHSFKANMARIRLCIEGLAAAMKSSPKELFYLSHSHEDWQKLMQHYSFEDSAHPEPYRNFYNRIALTNATMSKGMRGNSSVVKFLRTGAHLALYGLSNKKAHNQYEQFIASPDIQISRAVWNLPDRMLIKGFFRLFLKNVKHDQVLYIPRTDTQLLTLDFVESIIPRTSEITKDAEPEASPSLVLHEAAVSSEPTKDVISAYGNNYLTEQRHFSLYRDQKPHYLDEMGSSYNNELSEASSKQQFPLRQPYAYHVNKKNFDSELEVMIRLICNRPLLHDLKTGKLKRSGGFSFGKSFRCCGGAFEDPKESDIPAPLPRTNTPSPNGDLVIHIHGGGFIAMSSFSHSTYTRQWAVDANVPIFSIDYRLAPEHPYPKALDDCWQAYYWIIKHSEELLGIPPRKVILVGDSAGGNLVLGVTLRALQTKFKRPDGLILCYPALNLSLNTFNPSHLISLEDLILPYSFLKICLQLYVKDGNPDKDPFLSPILTPDCYLQQFPPTRIMVAGKDPIRDDSFKFALKLLQADTNLSHLGIDVHIKEFRTFPHGFLSYDMPMGIKECKRGVIQGTKWIKELLEIASHKEEMRYTDSWDSFRKSHMKTTVVDYSHQTTMVMKTKSHLELNTTVDI